MMGLGGTGVISVASHVAGPRIAEMVDAQASGDHTRALRLHLELLPLFKALFMTAQPDHGQGGARSCRASRSAACGCRSSRRPRSSPPSCERVHGAPRPARVTATPNVTALSSENAPGGLSDTPAARARARRARPTAVARARSRTETTMTRKKTRLRVIPLGGLDEIGKNMTVVEYGDDMVVIDAGLMFPDDDLPGVDLVLPDYGYVVKRARQAARHRHHARPRGPHRRAAVPAQGPRQDGAGHLGTELTLGLIGGKLDEHKLEEAQAARGPRGEARRPRHVRASTSSR